MLFIGDEVGKVAVQDLSAILRKVEGLEEVDVTDMKKTGIKRNPYRLMKMQVDRNFHEGIQTEKAIPKHEAKIDQSEIRQICTYQPHKDVIRSIQFIYSTDRPLIMTASLDRFVKIYSVDLHNAEDVAQREKGFVSGFVFTLY